MVTFELASGEELNFLRYAINNSRIESCESWWY